KDPDATADNIQKAQDALDKARAAYDQLLQDMQLNGGFLARQIAHKAATLDEIRAALPPDTTLIVYSIGDPNSVVFLITDKTLDAVILNVTTDQIQEQVAAFNADRRTNADALSKLYQLVIAPIADKLKTKHLIIAPDQGLNYVPFA